MYGNLEGIVRFSARYRTLAVSSPFELIFTLIQVVQQLLTVFVSI